MKGDQERQRAFKRGETYAAFTSEEHHGADLEFISKMQHLKQTCVIDEKTLSRLKEVTDEVKLLAIGERWCPDSIINLPALALMTEVNPKIQLRILERSGLDQLLISAIGTEKVPLPTVLVFQSDVLMGVFMERPNVVIEAEASDDQLRKIQVMKAYREGRYMVETICDVLGLLEDE